ncbi:hypothetical protein A3Q56_05819 [Intoshia linei]|uniref:BHLH domain-containing protein n=1 Tax=Intoshia linei TaxID=1819745 RepID=A0A177AX81_9BILA|nr:hypothetical protein A3Q56_05819 [Intoshia linei]
MKQLKSQNGVHIEIKNNKRNRANDRERVRMKCLNKAIDDLRDSIPQFIYMDNSDSQYSNICMQSKFLEPQKLTKMETIRYAYEYIKYLKNFIKLYGSNLNQQSRTFYNLPNYKKLEQKSDCQYQNLKEYAHLNYFNSANVSFNQFIESQDISSTCVASNNRFGTFLNNSN